MSQWNIESHMYGGRKRISAYLSLVRILRTGHETFALFQISQSVPEGTTGATVVPDRRAAIYQLLCAQRKQRTGLHKNLSFYTFHNRVSVATSAASLVHRRSNEAIFAPIQTFWYVTIL